MRSSLNKYLFLLLFITSYAALGAQERDLPVYNNEFWFFGEAEPLFSLSEDKLSSEKRAAGSSAGSSVGSSVGRNAAKEKIKEVLEEAVFVYSGMIYGFNFSYTPGDIRRGIDEIFEITPAAVIKAGDPALSARKTRRDGAKTYIQIEYRCVDSQWNWISYWRSSTFPLAGGTAEGSALPGIEGRKEAVSASVKETIRSFMRGRIHNKPRSITGSFVFEEPPVITYMAGLYSASVKIRLEIRDIESYTVF